MSDAPELKPCPFCGGQATWAKTGKGWKVECEGRMGSCSMNARTHYQSHKNLAIAAWNTRTAIDPTTLIKAALERAASIAKNACLVPPDGGSPTPEEEDVCRAAADYIEALADDHAEVAAIIKKAGEDRG